MCVSLVLCVCNKNDKQMLLESQAVLFFVAHAAPCHTYQPHVPNHADQAAPRLVESVLMPGFVLSLWIGT